MKKLILLLALLFPLAASAWVIIDDQTVAGEGSYVEPTENTDGSAVQLREVVVEYSVDQGASWQESTRIAASTPAGGELINAHFPAPMAAGQSGNIMFRLYAVDVNDLRSEYSSVGSIFVGRAFPNAPVEFSVR